MVTIAHITKGRHRVSGNTPVASIAAARKKLESAEAIRTGK
jgi:hypothetical protein